MIVNQILPRDSKKEIRAPSRWDETRSDLLVYLVGDTGIEPVTSSVSSMKEWVGQVVGLRPFCLCRGLPVGVRELPRRSRGRGYGLVVFARVRVDAGGRPGLGCRSSIRPAGLGGMVIYDRDRAGSIKEATTPPADGGQTRNDPRPVVGYEAQRGAVASTGTRQTKIRCKSSESRLTEYPSASVC